MPFAGKTVKNLKPKKAERQFPAFFDPLLDPQCRVVLPRPVAPGKIQWIWHPGQLAAIRHRARFQASLERCAHMGYPGSFRQPETHAYFRRKARLDKPQEIRWAGPGARMRLIVNGQEGDITSRSLRLPAGEVDLVMRVDFAQILPCLWMDGGESPFSTDKNWESSLDFIHWSPVETDCRFRDSGLPPDSPVDIAVEILPRALVQSRKVKGSSRDFRFEPGGEIIVDFFHDELGEIAFELEGKGTVTVQVGESEAEVKDPGTKSFEQYPLPPVWAGAGKRAVRLPERCVRYARIHSTGRACLSGLRFVARVAPVEYQGRFHCDDQEINAIWAAGAATLHACDHDFILDGIRRDALCWADGAFSTEAADCLFNDALTTRNTLLAITLPESPAVSDFGIVDAPLYALLGLENDWLARGDIEFSRRFQDRWQVILEFFLGLRDKRGFVNSAHLEPYGFFSDWTASAATGPDRQGIPAYAQMLLMRAFEIGAAFAGRWDDPALAQRCAGAAGALRKEIRAAFWDSGRGAFINGIDRAGREDRRFTSFAQVLAVLYDLASPAEWPALFSTVLENPRCRAENLSPFHFYEFQAYAKAGRTSQALGQLKEVWGGMLKQGRSRFAEDILPKKSPLDQLAMYGRPYANSLCHAWGGAAAVILLVRGVLGIWPTEGGYSECLVQPQLAHLEQVKGRIPAPQGFIELEMKRGAGGTLRLPAEVTAHLKGCAGSNGETSLAGPGAFRLLWKP